MLEIVVVYFLCKGVGDILRKKNRSPLPFQIMTVVFWIGGEIAGGIVWGVLQVIQGRQPEGFDITLYLFALVGAVIGAGFSFAIAALIPSAQQQQPFYGYGPGQNFPGGPASGNPYNPYDASTPPQQVKNPFRDQ